MKYSILPKPKQTEEKEGKLFLRGRKISVTKDIDDRVKKAAEKGVGIELNYGDMTFSDEEEKTILRPYRIAKKCGCKFYLGCDAHHPSSLERANGFFKRAIDYLELEETDKFII